MMNTKASSNAHARKWVLLAGGSSDTGVECARVLVAEGFCPIITYQTRRDSAEKLVKDLQSQAADSFAWNLDVTDHGGVKRFACELDARGIQLSGLVCLASYCRPEGGYQNDLFTLDISDLHSSLEVDLIGTVLLLKWMVPRITAGGAVVTFSSASALSGDTDLLQYLPARLSLSAYTRAFARKLAPGVRINCVAPGALDTQWLMTWNLPEGERLALQNSCPVKRLGTTRDIAWLVEYLLSPRAAFITGQTIVVDGGLFCP